MRFVSSRKNSVVFARLLATTIALCAFALPIGAKSKSDDANPRQDQPFIAETHVFAPQRVGEFLLEGTRRYDAKDKFGGVSFRYQHPDYPQLRVDLFVYPIGQREVEQALDVGMRNFLSSMQPAVDAGLYRDVIEGETIEFDLDLPLNDLQDDRSSSDADTRRGVTAENRAEIDDKDAKETEKEALLAQLLTAGKHIDGRRMSLSYDYHGDTSSEWFPMRSRTYLFYRQLHYFKGRISVAASQIDEAAYAAFTDRAMRELVPAVQAYNIGSCGDSTVYVNVDVPKEEAADQIMRSLIEISTRSARDNCHSAADEKELTKLRQSAAVETFVYSTTDWKAK